MVHILGADQAVESSIINNTMLFQITLLAWVFLGEQLTWQKVMGMAVASLGTLVVQIHKQQARHQRVNP